MSENKYPETLELAMLAVQSELTNPIKDGTNPHFKSKYATLPEIRNLITPILAKQGLYIVQNILPFEGGTFLESSIIHAPSKQSFKSMMPLMMEKQTPQGQGSALTYARRYALCAMLNIAADEDDDGQSAEKPAPKPQQPKPAPAAPKVAKPMPDAEYEAARIGIVQAETMEALSSAFTAGYTAAKTYGDKPAMEGLTRVKDIRKNELQKQTQGE